MSPIGHQIYLRRRSEKLTQAELARRARISQPNLSDIEKGKQDITVTTLRKIAVALSAHPAEFLSEGEEFSQEAALTRSKIERVARGVYGSGKGLHPKERELVRLLRTVIPQRGRIRARTLSAAWLELRKRLSAQEIQSILERAKAQRQRLENQ